MMAYSVGIISIIVKKALTAYWLHRDEGLFVKCVPITLQTNTSTKAVISRLAYSEEVIF